MNIRCMLLLISVAAVDKKEVLATSIYKFYTFINKTNQELYLQEMSEALKPGKHFCLEAKKRMKVLAVENEEGDTAVFEFQKKLPYGYTLELIDDPEAETQGSLNVIAKKYASDGDSSD